MGNKQLPYSSEELSGKVVIVTGGTAGIGYETVKSLVKRGARTFIACSSRKRAEAVSAGNIFVYRYCMVINVS